SARHILRLGHEHRYGVAVGSRAEYGPSGANVANPDVRGLRSPGFSRGKHVTVPCLSQRTLLDRPPVDQRRAVEADNTILIRYCCTQLDDGLVLPHGKHLDLASDGVPDADRMAEVPLHPQEDAARARKLVGDDSIEDARDHTALHNRGRVA